MGGFGESAPSKISLTALSSWAITCIVPSMASKMIPVGIEKMAMPKNTYKIQSLEPTHSF